MASITDPKRVSDAREKLKVLKSLGYEYIVTSDDGETWVGSQEQGIEIDLLMSHCFLGRIAVDSPAAFPTQCS